MVNMMMSVHCCVLSILVRYRFYNVKGTTYGNAKLLSILVRYRFYNNDDKIPNILFIQLSILVRYRFYKEKQKGICGISWSFNPSKVQILHIGFGIVGGGSYAFQS